MSINPTGRGNDKWRRLTGVIVKVNPVRYKVMIDKTERAVAMISPYGLNRGIGIPKQWCSIIPPAPVGKKGGGR